MSKRTRRPRTSPPRKPRRRVREEPDLLWEVSQALRRNEPLVLLGLASAALAAFDPRSRGPFEDAAEGPSRDEMTTTMMSVPMFETSALLAALAALSGDEVLSRRVRREITDRDDHLPRWLADLPGTTAVPRAVEVTHVLGDGDDVLVAVTLPGGQALTAVVYIDHNLGTLVKDAFVVPAALDDVVKNLGDAAGPDPDTTARPIDPADARARIVEAVELGATTFPPFESETWPACRPLVEWMVGLLPAGGTGYRRPDWDDEATAGLAGRFLASDLGTGADPDLLSSLLWFGTDYGPGDPMRWSPTAAEILLLDWIPRKIIDDPAHLAAAPALLRAFVRFCDRERGIRETLTAETVAAIDVFEPEYQRIIRSDRQQGPAGLLAAMGLDVGDDDDDLNHAVGGGAALDALDATPLPDEPFGWEGVPDDVRGPVGEVLELVDRCCTELLDTEYRTACRRLLADAAHGDPGLFRGRGRPATTAAAICWVAGHANSLFDREPAAPKLAVKDVTGHFGSAGSAASQRSVAVLRAIGVGPRNDIGIDLGSPRYLTGARRARIIARRDRYRADGG